MNADHEPYTAQLLAAYEAVLAAPTAHEVQLINWLRTQQPARPAEPASPGATVARNAPIR